MGLLSQVQDGGPVIALALLLALECADVAKLIAHESGWRAGAVSSKGCCGLLQASPRHLDVWLGRRWTCRELKHPLFGLGAGLAMRARWQARAERAGKPGCWRQGYRAGNEGFRRCRARLVGKPVDSKSMGRGSTPRLGAERP